MSRPPRDRFPSQIKYLAWNEGCERFSFYGMTSILTIYMVTFLGVREPDAEANYHFFVFAVYLTPLVGAWIADRFLGRYQVILWLSLGYVFGHAAIAIWESPAGLVLGLSLIAIGAGGIKPTAAAYVGDQFDARSQHLLEKVYDLYYWMINLGSFTSMLVIPELLARFGPWVAFSVPGVLMAFALVIFWRGRRLYVNVPPTGPNPNGFFRVVRLALKRLGTTRPGEHWLDPARAQFPAEAVDGAKAVFRILGVFAPIAAFWALFFQYGSSWVLQAERMNREILGYTVKASQMGSLNAIFVLTTIPVFAGLVYPALQRRGVKTLALQKMQVGMFVTVLSFLWVMGVQVALDAGLRPHVAWQVPAYLFLSIGEVLVSVTALEFAYTQAPPSMKSVIMSLSYVTIAAGSLLTAGVAKLNRFHGLWYFAFFAVLMFIGALAFAWVARRYQPTSFAAGPGGAGGGGRSVERCRAHRDAAAIPPQIPYIMASEGAERFSFYGMRNILAAYTAQASPASEADSKASYHYFVMANYLMPLVGGWLADRFLGRYKVILFLSFGYVLGHLVVAAVETCTGLLAGLALIAIGAGGIKPCVSAFVGDQFRPDQKHLLARVYGLFYWMVNLGSATASLLIPFLLKRYGPAVAFGVPGALMVLALVFFVAGRRRYVNFPPTGPNPDSFVKVVASALRLRGERPPGSDWLEPARAVHPAEAVDGARAVVRISGVFVMVAGFWALFDQKGASFILQAKQMNLDVGTVEILGMRLGGFRLEASQLNAVNPFLVLLLVPLFQGVVYPGLVRLGVKVTALGKMSLGMFLTMFSFVVMAAIQAVIDGGARPSVFWQVLPILILTMGEVMISVTGLEFAFTQAPRTMKSTIMSFWLLTSAVGNFVAAVVSQWNRFHGAAYFLFFAALMFFCAVGFVLLARRYRPVASVVGG